MGKRLARPVVRTLARDHPLDPHDTLVWLRVPGDIVFAIGTVLLAVFAVKLLRAKRSKLEIREIPATQKI